MTRGRLAAAAWTTAVVLAASVALAGIGWFMVQVHEGRWWRTSGKSANTAPAEPARIDTGKPGEARAEPSARSTPSTPSAPPTAARPLPSGTAVGSTAALVESLRARSLTIPVLGATGPSLVQSFDQARGSRRHDALDIMAPTGTPVVAVEDGTIAKLFTSAAGGLTIYQFDPSRVVAYYYAHLDRYATGISEGDTVRRGQVLGYVGATGNADKDAPHLHFAISKLGPEGRWWEGEPVDPYAVLRR